jgi:hypothetical protein
MKDGKRVKTPMLPPTERALATPLQVYGGNFETRHRPTSLSEILKTEPLR